jgi:hypothetical protein
MQRCLLACLTTLSLALSASAQDKAPRHAKYPRWITDYSGARAIARASDQPMLVVLRCEP